MADIYWYYMQGDQVLGPRPEKELRGKIKTAELPITTHVMKAEGKSNWHPAYEAFGLEVNTFSGLEFSKFAGPVFVLFAVFFYLNIYAFSLDEKWGKAGPAMWSIAGIAAIAAAIAGLFKMGATSRRWTANIPDAKAGWLKAGWVFGWIVLVLFIAYFIIFLLWGAKWSLLQK